ncbi:MAG: J domain-containing protein [Thermodesulfobacteriota bacterium]|nr:J domain-containing protein [Thermodesulfobacteriota bacterium]
MAEIDYYKILGISKTAPETEIKKAYRKLALKYHPDRTKGDKALEAKFKEISEAYAVLSDKEKRQQYDTYGSADFQQRYSREDIFRNFDMGDILKEFGFGGRGRGRGGGFSSSMGGMGGNSFFQGMGGGCQRKKRDIKGDDLEYEIALSLEEIMTGTKKTISINHGSINDSLTVKIPKGMTTGKKIRVPGRGDTSPYGGPRGDLFIKSQLLANPYFEIKENNLFTTKEIKLTEALLGTKINITTPVGKDISLNIPPGTRHKAKMRLEKQGLPHLHKPECGDLFVVVHVEMPKELNKEQKKLVEKLVKTGL